MTEVTCGFQPTGLVLLPLLALSISLLYRDLVSVPLSLWGGSNGKDKANESFLLGGPPAGEQPKMVQQLEAAARRRNLRIRTTGLGPG